MASISMVFLTKFFAEQAVKEVNSGNYSGDNSALDYKNPAPTESETKEPEITSSEISKLPLPDGVLESSTPIAPPAHESEFPKVQNRSGDSNYLLVGVDSRAGSNSQVGAGDADSVGGARSDTIMLAHVPENKEKITVLSFPRDLSVNRPACQRWDSETNEYSDEIIPAVKDAKINSAYAVGGPRCLVGVVQQLTGLELTNFVGIDFAGFESMVDKIGGVEVCSPTPLKDAELGVILPKAGKQTLDGKQALNYVRARKIQDEGQGDYSRIRRQQLFLSAFAEKVLSKDFLSSPNKLLTFVKTGVNSTFGENINFEELQGLVTSMRGKGASGVKFITVPTKGSNNNWNEILDEAKLGAVISDMTSTDDNSMLQENLPSNSVVKPEGKVEESNPQDNKGVKLC